MKTKALTQKAFTVFELFIVIAILTILVLLLGPALTSHRGARASALTCDNNLKQIGVAFRLTRKDVAQGGAVFLVSLDDVLENTLNASELKATTDGQDCPFTYQVLSMMSNELNTPKLVVCPDDERTFHTNFNVVLNNGGSDTKQLLNQYVSYFVGKDVNEINPLMIQCGDRNIGSSAAGPNSAYGFSKAPADNSGYAKEFGTNALNDSAQWTTTMHDKQGNVLFADGHVEKLSSTKLREAMKNSGDRNSTATKGNFLLFP